MIKDSIDLILFELLYSEMNLFFFFLFWVALIFPCFCCYPENCQPAKKIDHLVGSQHLSRGEMERFVFIAQDKRNGQGK